MGLINVIQNMGSPDQFLCSFNYELGGAFVWTILLIVMILVFIAVYVKKKDLFIGFTSMFFSAFLVSLSFRIYTCTVYVPLISTKYVIIFFIASVSFGALVKAQSRNDS